MHTSKEAIGWRMLASSQADLYSSPGGDLSGVLTPM